MNSGYDREGGGGGRAGKGWRVRRVTAVGGSISAPTCFLSPPPFFSPPFLSSLSLSSARQSCSVSAHRSSPRSVRSSPPHSRWTSRWANGGATRSEVKWSEALWLTRSSASLCPPSSPLRTLLLQDARCTLPPRQSASRFFNWNQHKSNLICVA